MSHRDDYEDNVKALRRMIAYIRHEATRLRIADVALLLERAEHAVALSVPVGASKQDRPRRRVRDGSPVEH